MTTISIFFINDDLHKINEWLVINKLSLNITKSKYMLFQKAKEIYKHLIWTMQMLNKSRYSFFGFNYAYKSKVETTLKQITNACSKWIGV